VGVGIDVQHDGRAPRGRGYSPSCTIHAKRKDPNSCLDHGNNVFEITLLPELRQALPAGNSLSPPAASRSDLPVGNRRFRGQVAGKNLYGLGTTGHSACRAKSLHIRRTVRQGAYTPARIVPDAVPDLVKRNLSTETGALSLSLLLILIKKP
jgi:hypothetical protein